ncbi:LytR/AlgR family response regulator transcription factor [Alteromonas oceanisediminis]|uniref:LytR/AlgR family response regulator transcription factor n=1 Tax=Alteromonas oceanisediminis TaxID=2836180 RepID=UPI001BDAD669|nr:LytTR family DNA-binding domain-containing protein [Alteromonas oceanisediminis]MBT0587175.1 LytTR family DNA-binding domain-containing protein [Alteromonas oceanisediminis]
MFKVLVVDDETIARNNITILLGERDDISYVAEADNGEKALELLQSEHFDIVFLDIQMPKLNGLEVADLICSHQITAHIVFVTAFNQHAVNAFDVNAVDYLLKPFHDSRFHQSVNKAIHVTQCEERFKQVDNIANTIGSLFKPLNNKANKIALKETGRIKLIDIDDIQYIKGAGNYVEIVFVSDKTLLHRETLKSIYHKLPPDRFTRIHKSTIVRNDLITELGPTPKGDYWLNLKTGAKLLMSRRNRELLEKLP